LITERGTDDRRIDNKKTETGLIPEEKIQKTMTGERRRKKTRTDNRTGTDNRRHKDNGDED
jgi:hypothetical protein